jgi:hypothetical protein
MFFTMFYSISPFEKILALLRLALTKRADGIAMKMTA